MKKKAAIILLIALLLALALFSILPLEAQEQTQNIVTINADGTVIPTTAPIRQNGTIYTLTDDFEGSLLI